MLTMRPLSPNHRLQGFSLPEVVREWEKSSLDVPESEQFNGRKIKPGPLLNAVVLAFMETLPTDKQQEMISYGLRRLEALMAKETAPSAEGIAPLANETVVNHIPEVRTPPSTRKGK